jgi:hypothetical protein
MNENDFFYTLGGRVRCMRCTAKSKRTGQQCRLAALKGMTKCRFHGGRSTGPKTDEGKQRCAEAKTIHGRETRKARTERSVTLGKLAELEAVGRVGGVIAGPKASGRPPKPRPPY